MSVPSDEMAALALKNVAAPQLPKGTKGTKKQVVTNSFNVLINLKTPFYLHDFRVNAVFVNPKGEEKLKEVTKQTRDDFVEQDRKRAALLACNAVKKVLLKDVVLIYDRAAILISLQELPQCKGSTEFTHVLTRQTAKSLFDLDVVKDAKEVRVTIKRAADSYQVISDDVKNKDAKIEKAILSVINLATSQSIFEKFDDFVVYGNGNAYLLKPHEHGFSDFDVGAQDKYGGVGLTKGARVITGPKGERSAALTIDTKKSAFHLDWQKVSEKMSQMNCANNPLEATAGLAGLKCLVFYSGIPKAEQKARTMTIGKVSNSRVKDISFKDHNGKSITMAQYVKSKYKTTIDPNALTIIDKYNHDNHYSPDCLLVCPNQRMKSENAQRAVIEKLIRESATLPERRLAETRKLAGALELSTSNKVQVARAMTVNTAEPIKVDGRVLAPVTLGTGDKNIIASGPWTQGKYAQNPTDDFKSWTLLHLKSHDREPDLSKAVVDALHKATSLGGYKMADKMRVKLMAQPLAPPQQQELQLTRIFEDEKKAGCQFLFIITSHQVNNHGLIKFLELKHSIITQQITTKTAEKITHQSNTASNIAIKLIEKLGGQNHYIARATPDLPPWLTKGTMICGVQMEMPQALTGKEKEQNAMPSRPVFIGWSSDAVRDAHKRGATDAQHEKEATHFSGGWTYAMPKDFKEGNAFAASYKAVILGLLKSYKNYRASVPARILLIRGGVAQGDLDKIRAEELPIWQDAFHSLSPQYNPTFIIVAASDSHVDRFYDTVIKGAKAPQQNLPSGTVIDSVVTNPNKNQAYIQAHVPLQGTAKVPLYSVEHVHLNPGHKMTTNMDEIIRTVHALCFAHGVCNTPTAVPTPLYVARESMKRAAEQFAFYNRKNGGRPWKIEELVDQLTIKENSSIHGYRVNA